MLEVLIRNNMIEKISKERTIENLKELFGLIEEKTEECIARVMDRCDSDSPQNG